MRDSVLDYLDRMQKDLDLARQRYTQANGDAKFHNALAADHIAKVQRLSSCALHAAVTGAHDAGMSWRDLAPHVGLYFQTLHRQWANGGRIDVVAHD